MLAAGAVALTAVFVAATGASAATYPPGFSEQVVFSGLSNPTAVRFASDGRVFVAEKNGRIKVFDSLTDPTATVFADLNVNVYNFWDRGLLGLALAPNFPADPYVYVLYTYDHELGSAAPAPRWGTPGVLSDPCPTPPGPTADGCMVSGRLSRLQASGNTMIGQEQVLIEDWCQQYPSHSIGALDFGQDGALYVTGGDGASFNFADWGQDGAPLNPCGDPPGGVGAGLSPPTAEGGALRSQDLRTPTDPTSLDGALLRVNPANGAGLPDNPNATSTDANARRIVAYGLRNPFRLGVRPGTGEVWIGDVGWNTWEEIQRIQQPTAAVVNFGWPCYEGVGRQGGYDGANLNICENLYAQGTGAVQAPHYAWNHSLQVVPGEGCPTGSSSAAGIAFGPTSGSNYPSEYRGALFFADYSRDCIWAMLPDANGVPDPARIHTFAAGAANPVHLQIGPGGNLFYPDFDGGTIRRVTFTSTNQSPNAAITASPTTGPAPLTVSFDGTASSDPEGQPLSYAWDLNGDGTFTDATGPTASYTYSIAGAYTATLRVTDDQSASDTDSVTITVGNTPPTTTIDGPAAGTTWKVGDVINFAGHATDAQDGTLPASALSWRLLLQHCPSNCHTHVVQAFAGVTNGSFTAPDHEYPSYLELELTATDSGGLTNIKTLRLDPRTVTLTFSSTPGGLQLAVNGATATATFTRTVIQGSTNTISAITPQMKGKKTYNSASWSDGGPATHTITAPTTNATYTARFR